MGNTVIPKELIREVLMNHYELMRTSVVLCKESRRILYNWLDENFICLSVIHMRIPQIRYMLYDDAVFSILCCVGSSNFTYTNILEGVTTITKTEGCGAYGFQIKVEDELVFTWPGCKTCNPPYEKFEDLTKEILRRVGRSLMVAVLLQTGACFGNGYCYCEEYDKMLDLQNKSNI